MTTPSPSPPPRDLDALVAERLFPTARCAVAPCVTGNMTWGGEHFHWPDGSASSGFRPTKYADDALRALAEVTRRGWHFSLTNCHEGRWCVVIVPDADDAPMGDVVEDSFGLAVTVSALRALGEDV